MSVWRIGIRGLKITLLNPNFVLRRILIRTFLVGLHLKLRLGHFHSYQLVGRCSRRTIGNILKVFLFSGSIQIRAAKLNHRQNVPYEEPKLFNLGP